MPYLIFVEFGSDVALHSKLVYLVYPTLHQWIGWLVSCCFVFSSWSFCLRGLIIIIITYLFIFFLLFGRELSEALGIIVSQCGPESFCVSGGWLFIVISLPHSVSVYPTTCIIWLWVISPVYLLLACMFDFVLWYFDLHKTFFLLVLRFFNEQWNLSFW